MDFQEKLFYLLVEGSLGSKRFSRLLRSKKINNKAKNNLHDKQLAIRQGHLETIFSNLSRFKDQGITPPNLDYIMIPHYGNSKVMPNRPIVPKFLKASTVKASHKIRNTKHIEEKPENFPLQGRLKNFKFMKKYRQNKNSVQEGSLGDKRFVRKFLSKKNSQARLGGLVRKRSAQNKGFGITANTYPDDYPDKKRIERRIRKQKSTDMSRVDKYKHIKGLD